MYLVSDSVVIRTACIFVFIQVKYMVLKFFAEIVSFSALIYERCSFVCLIGFYGFWRKLIQCSCKKNLQGRT